MINKDLYFMELEELLNKNNNLNKDDFILLYEIVTDLTTEETGISSLADKIVKNLSGNIFESMISWDFLNTEIGKALIKAKFGIGNDIFFTNDLASILSCSKQFISKEIKSGNIQAKKRGGIIYFTENDIRQYLSKKKKKMSVEKKEIIYEETKEKFDSSHFERENNYN